MLEKFLTSEGENKELKESFTVAEKINWYRLGVWLLIGIFCVSCWYYGFKFGWWLVSSLFT